MGNGDGPGAGGNPGGVMPLWGPECNRGGRVASANWKTAATEAQVQNAKAFDFLLFLVSASEVEASGSQSWVRGLKDCIQQTSWNPNTAFIDNSVFSIARRCVQGEVMCASTVFAHMISNIQLVLAENR